jgi:hypothetical protein
MRNKKPIALQDEIDNNFHAKFEIAKILFRLLKLIDKSINY